MHKKNNRKDFVFYTTFLSRAASSPGIDKNGGDVV